MTCDTRTIGAAGWAVYAGAVLLVGIATGYSDLAAFVILGVYVINRAEQGKSLPRRSAVRT